MSAQVPLPLWSQDLQFSTLTEQWLTQRTGTEIRFIASACGFKVTLGVPELRIKLRQLATGSLAQQSLTVAAVKKSADNAESADRNNQDQPSQHASGGSISKQASIHALQDVTGSEAWMRPADVDDEVFEAPMETSTAANKTPLHTEGQMRRSGATGGARISSSLPPTRSMFLKMPDHVQQRIYSFSVEDELRDQGKEHMCTFRNRIHVCRELRRSYLTRTFLRRLEIGHSFNLNLQDGEDPKCFKVMEDIRAGMDQKLLQDICSVTFRVQQPEKMTTWSLSRIVQLGYTFPFRSIRDQCDSPSGDVRVIFQIESSDIYFHTESTHDALGKSRRAEHIAFLHMLLNLGRRLRGTQLAGVDMAFDPVAIWTETKKAPWRRDVTLWYDSGLGTSTHATFKKICRKWTTLEDWYEYSHELHAERLGQQLARERSAVSSTAISPALHSGQTPQEANAWSSCTIA